MSTIQLRLDGEIGGIGLPAFLLAAEKSLAVLRDLDAAISHTSKGTLDWVVKDLRTGSLLLEIESRSRVEERNVGPEVARSFVEGLKRVEHAGTTPPYLSETGVRNLSDLVKLIGHDGLAGLQVSDLARTVEVTARSSANVGQLLKPRSHALGSVEGTLETISIHRQPRFIVYESRTRKAVTCRIADEHLLAKARDALGRRVAVAGTVQSNAKGEPLRVDVQDLRILRQAHELPSIADLAGSDPDFTGNMSTADYVRSLRSA